MYVIQEHWLHTDQLHKLNDFNSDFLSVAVSGMDSGSLLCGRPYGGCSVLYRKSLSSCIINPRRACAARVTVVVLCVCLSVCPRLFSDYRLRGGL